MTVPLSPTRWRKLAGRCAPWLFAAPALLLFGLFLAGPFLMALSYSFTNKRLLAPPDLGAAWVGLRNYERLFRDPEAWAAARNNLLFAGVVVPVQSALALGLALLVNRHLPGSRFFRTVYFAPVATTLAVVAVVWSLLYLPEGGAANALVDLATLGRVGPRDWLRDPGLVLPAIMVLSIWQGAGFQMLVFLGGLQAVPRDLLEAAELDGAGPLRRFLHITLPLLRPTTVFVLVTTTIQSFQLFTQVQVIASGGASAPLDSFRTTVMLLVHEGFRRGRVGYASALSVLFFLLVLAISLLQRRLLKGSR
ncbi:MAG TPA: sugar ABC transporter permease [Holophaga sp.]|nr:sugar ABC transporter permease [Holophaga sp.]